MNVKTKIAAVALGSALSVVTLLGGLMLNNSAITASAAENDEIETIAAGAFDGGDGSQENPYLIGTETALAYFFNGANTYNGYYYYLTTDITYTGTFTTKRFGGHFYGNNHTITIMGITLSTSKAALFSLMVQEFKDVNFVINSYSMNGGSNDYIGFLTQENRGTISNVTITVNNNITVGASRYFGLVASYNHSVIDDVVVSCYLTTKVAPSYLGVVAGCNEGTLNNCRVTKGIDLCESYNSDKVAGGICGYSSGKISECIYSGTLTVDAGAKYKYVGGIVGQISKSSLLDHNYLYGYINVVSSATVASYGNIYGIVKA